MIPLQTRAGRVPSTQFLEVVKAAGGGEREYTVWEEVDAGVGTLGNCLAGDKALAARFDRFVQDAYAPVADSLGWEPAKGEGRYIFKYVNLKILRWCGTVFL